MNINLYTKTFIILNILISSVSYASPYLKDKRSEFEPMSTFKTRFNYSIMDSKQTNFEGKQNLKPEKLEHGQLIKNGYGLSSSINFFLNDYVSTELGCGINFHTVNQDEFKIVKLNYSNIYEEEPTVSGNDNPGLNKKRDIRRYNKYKNGTNNKTIAKNPDYSGKKQILSIPLRMSIQLYPLPASGIRPYIGAGYHVNYVTNNIPELKIKLPKGPICSFGIDLVTKDNTVFNIEATKYFAKTEFEYTGKFINGKIVKSKSDFAPLIISFGIGYKF